MLVDDLKDTRLNYWAAKAADFEPRIVRGLCMVTTHVFDPNVDWVVAGMLINMYHISIDWDSGACHARLSMFDAFGEDARDAAMRVLVKSVFGEMVSDEV